MKVENEGVPLILQNGQQDGQMARNEQITAVLLQDGWHAIQDFQMLKTFKNVPFIRFTMCLGDLDHVVEVFPNSLYGVAYEKKEDNDTDSV